MKGHLSLVLDSEATLRHVRNEMKLFGKNATTFITLYEGFEYFVGKFGTIAYVNTSTAWVAGGEPLCSDENAIIALEEFFAAAEKAGKRALLLPASKSLAEKARARNFWSAQIGMEPWMPLENGNTRSDYFKFLPVAKQLKANGAIVTEFRLSDISTSELNELKSLANRWLDSRKSAALGFLNRFEPFSLSEDKIYFKLQHEGILQGFIAAVQVPSRNAWYLVDLVRSPDASTGTTELLVIEAMEVLRSRGVKEVTLGMSPLTPVHSHEIQKHPKLYSLLNFVYKNGGSFYGFKSLFNYKDKFQPKIWEPCFIVVSDTRFRWQHAYGLFNAIYPAGILATVKSTFQKMIQKFRPDTSIAPLISQRIVARPLPSSWIEYFFEMKAVTTLILIHLTFYFANPAVETIGFSWNRMLEDGVSFKLLSRVVFSSLYHGHPDHLIVNMILLALFGGLLEVTAGSLITVAAFLAGTLFSNVLTANLLNASLSLTSTPIQMQFASEIDNGCSLGVFAILGAMLPLLKHSKMTALVASLGILGFCIIEHSFIELNHFAAMLIGLLLAKTLFKI